MKCRSGFVSNSSSTSFIIKNTSKSTKTLVDFVNETPQLIEEFMKMYDWEKGKVCQAQLLFGARELNVVFKPGEKKECVFGDEQGTVIGRVYDYILRDGGKSKSFSWKFNEYLR